MPSTKSLSGPFRSYEAVAFVIEDQGLQATSCLIRGDSEQDLGLFWPAQAVNDVQVFVRKRP